MGNWDDPPDNKYLGLTSAQFNLAVLAIVGGGVVAAALYFGVLDAVRGGGEPSSPEAAVVETVTPTATRASTESPGEASSVAVFDRADCQFITPAGERVECGYLTVPEYHSKPDGRTIRLHVAIFRAKSDNPAPDPIVYLDGGPGGSPLKAMSLIFDAFRPFLANRDLIFVDQRGVGYSEPPLNCHELQKLEYQTVQQEISLEEESTLIKEAAKECHDRLLRRAANPAAYTSAENAADLNDLRLALGYEEWNLYGISYGTKLALTTMRDFPSGIRSVVLDSTYPLQVDAYAEMPANASRSFHLVFDGCAADAVCNATYPELETVFFDLVRQLNATPAKVSITAINRFTDKPLDYALVDGDRLVNLLFQALYISEIIPFLPEMIVEIRDGDYDLLAFVVESSLAADQSISRGMFFSVQCGEEVPFSSQEERAAGGEIYPEVLTWADSDPIFAICQSWSANEPAPIENEPVISDVRTLILAGEYDPITPPAWGQLVAENLSNSFYFEFPDFGHGVSLSGLCPLSITLAFLDDPTIEPDGSCR